MPSNPCLALDWFVRQIVPILGGLPACRSEIVCPSAYLQVPVYSLCSYLPNTVVSLHFSIATGALSKSAKRVPLLAGRNGKTIEAVSLQLKAKPISRDRLQ